MKKLIGIGLVLIFFVIGCAGVQHFKIPDYPDLFIINSPIEIEEQMKSILHNDQEGVCIIKSHWCSIDSNIITGFYVETLDRIYCIDNAHTIMTLIWYAKNKELPSWPIKGQMFHVSRVGAKKIK